MKVLIIDDSPQMREMMRHFLPAAREVHECDDGFDALAAYAEFLPDFVLMDWEMKRKNGLTATREILNDFPEACIFMVSQYDDAELRASAFETGARDFICKDNLLSLRSILVMPRISKENLI